MALEAVGGYSFPGEQHENEDRFVLLPEVLETSMAGPVAYFAVYDGHAGSMCADYLESNLHQKIFSPVARKAFKAADAPSESEICDMLRSGFLSAEQEVTALLRQQQDWSGAVCNAVILFNSRLYVANLGDCRAVLAKRRPGSPSRLPDRHYQLSDDHRPNREAEKQRIEQAGGFISKDQRVNGQLLFSRSFGDREFKYVPDREQRMHKIPALKHNKSKMCTDKPLVSYEPEIKVYHVDPNLDSYMIIASDGLWDVISSKRVVALFNQYMSKYKTLEEVAHALEREARQKGSMDDVTIIIVLLKEPFMTHSYMTA